MHTQWLMQELGDEVTGSIRTERVDADPTDGPQAASLAQVIAFALGVLTAAPGAEGGAVAPSPVEIAGDMQSSDADLGEVEDDDLAEWEVMALRRADALDLLSASLDLPDGNEGDPTVRVSDFFMGRSFFARGLADIPNILRVSAPWPVSMVAVGNSREYDEAPAPLLRIHPDGKTIDVALVEDSLLALVGGGGTYFLLERQGEGVVISEGTMPALAVGDRRFESAYEAVGEVANWDEEAVRRWVGGLGPLRRAELSDVLGTLTVRAFSDVGAQSREAWLAEFDRAAKVCRHVNGDPIVAVRRLTLQSHLHSAFA